MLNAVARQLVREPLLETRHRKPLRPNPVAPWELRFGALRVFYEVASGTSNVVHVLAVGKKEPPSNRGMGDQAMRKLSLAQASQSLAKYAAGLKNDIVVVTKGRRAVAALVPLKNVDRESLALSAHPEFLAFVKKARAEFAAGRSVSLEEIRARVLSETKASNPRLQRPVPARRR